MKNLVLFTILITAMFLGCKKDDAASTQADQFTDKLTVGTGMSGFTIVGETSSFTRMGGSATLYWRLESSVDMAGSSVKIRISKQGTGGFAPYDSATYTNPQSYGHIMLSSYSMAGTGSFRATGVLTASGKTVASKDFTVN